MRILIINGPNLNALGRREPQWYGTTPFDTYLQRLRSRFAAVDIDYFQSNTEGTLIDYLYREGAQVDGIVINAGAYAHTSIALADAIAAIDKPTVEVHISNVFAREPFRHHSYLSARCIGCIVGLGLEGYALAVSYLLHRLSPAG